MKQRFYISLAITTALLTSCTESGTLVIEPGSVPNDCTNKCNQNETVCDNNGKLKTCVEQENGCYDFVIEDCGTNQICSGGKCTAKGDAPTSPSCQNECNGEAPVCDGEKAVRSCVKNSEGCYEYQTQTCSGDLICKAGKCTTAGAEPTCNDECVAGYKACTEDGSSIVCGDFNNDGCLENMVAPCNDDEECKNGLCTKKGEAPDPCTDECTKAGLTECGANGVRTCGNYDADTCLEWSEEVQCGNGQTCKDGSCNCTNQCDTMGKSQCDGNGYKTCADTNGDGCLEWTSVTSCNGMQCKDGKCECNHACNAGAKECSGNGYRTCTADAQGCRIWSSVSACENGCTNGACNPKDVQAPSRYPGNQILSPITTYSVEQMKKIAKNGSRKSLHFAKLGDSHFAPGTVFMYCFSNTKTTKPILNGATFLNDVIQAYQSDGTDSYARDSVSAIIGQTVYGVMNKGYLQQELNTMNPLFAFIDYGSNDMGWYGYSRPSGSSNGFYYTLEWYYRQYRKAIKLMIDSGTIPLILGTGVQNIKTYQGKTLNYENPYYFVPIFNAVGRGLAEQYQIPFLDLAYLQMQEPLKSNNYGLSSDNLHHTNKGNGCDFSNDGMKYGANARNRYAIEMLDRAWKTVVQGGTAPDKVIPYEGKGTKDDPYIITSLPFTHPGNTKNGTNNISQYSCQTTNEGGPEIYYKLKVSGSKKIRAFSVSSEGVDVDLHLTSSTDGNSCKVRGDKWVEANLSDGTHYFIVDTYNSASNAGEYLFGIVECLPGDGLCGSQNIGG